MTDTPIVGKGSHDVASAAHYLSESPSTVKRLIAEGFIATYLPLGKKRGRRITHAELERYIAASSAERPIELREAS